MVTAQKRAFYANRKNELDNERQNDFKERDAHVLELKKNPYRNEELSNRD